MTDPTVRNATTADVPAIRRIAEAGWQATYESILAHETIDRALANWYDPEAIRQGIEDDDVLYFVAEREGTVRGYASGSACDESPVATLGAIYVDPAHWREGIGTALLTDFERACRKAGCDALEIRVLEGNDVGAAFYRKRGYQAVETRDADLFGESISERVLRGTIE